MLSTTRAEEDQVYSEPDVSPDSRPESVHWLELLLTFVLLSVFSYCGIALSSHSEGVSTIWFSNGLLFAIVIRKPRRVWLRYFALGLLADTVADLFNGDPLRLVLGVSIANSIEVLTASLVLTHWFGSPFNLSRRKPLFGFLAVAVIAGPAISSLLGPAAMLINHMPGPWWELVRTWYLGDALGMAIVAPLVFILQRPGFFSVLQRAELPKTLIALAVPLVATALVFNQESYPLIFAIFPPLLFVVFQRGFPGAVLAIFVTACVAIAFTVSGHGPLMLLSHATMLRKIIVLQGFLATALFTAFPVAALLEERKSLELSLQQSEAQYRELANTDALTGVRNRRAFDGRLNAEWYRPDSADAPLSMLLVDVDRFKAYNDIYGHIAGDSCLRRIATAMSKALPPELDAAVYRMGGEEFSVLLPGLRNKAAFLIAERLREAVASIGIEHSGSPLGFQTMSVGVATVTPQPEASAVHLLDLADRALYRAKHLGRNRCEVADDPLVPATKSDDPLSV